MRTTKKVPKPQAFRNYASEEKNYESNNEPKEVDEDQEVLEAFRTFDLDGDGTMSTREFVNMLNTCCPDLTKDDINEIINESALHEKGFLNYREFIDFWKQMSTE